MKVFSTTYAVEVYPNTDGDIVVKQEAPYGDDPAHVVIPVEHVSRLISALRQAKREAQD